MGEKGQNADWKENESEAPRRQRKYVISIWIFCLRVFLPLGLAFFSLSVSLKRDFPFRKYIYIKNIKRFSGDETKKERLLGGPRHWDFENRE